MERIEESDPAHLRLRRETTVKFLRFLKMEKICAKPPFWINFSFHSRFSLEIFLEKEN